MGYFVVKFGLTPREYWDLTLAEHDAIASAHNDLARRTR